MSKIEGFYYRQWLNRQGIHQAGSVLARCETPDEKHGHFEASLTISDCTRVIELSLSAYDSEDADNALYKLRTLKKAIIGLENQIKANREIKEPT